MKLRAGAIERILEWKPRTEKKFHQPRSIAIDSGIGGNTFRAFRGLEKSPSQVFRKWVRLEGFSLLEHRKVESRTDFQKIHSALERSIKEFWLSETGDLIVHYKKMKIVDLFVKELTFSCGHRANHLRDGFFEFANIPLDRFSLLEIKRCFVGIVISKNPSMSDVDDDETYSFLQDAISKMIGEFGVPNLVFDDFAWNSRH